MHKSGGKAQGPGFGKKQAFTIEVKKKKKKQGYSSYFGRLGKCHFIFYILLRKLLNLTIMIYSVQRNCSTFKETHYLAFFLRMR